MTQRLEKKDRFYKLSFIEYTRVDESVFHSLELSFAVLRNTRISRWPHRKVRHVRTYRNEVADMALWQD
jgi:hypothetical protein